MALIDNQNKVIYWDEVNWQWLPFVTAKVAGANVYFRLQYNGTRTKVSSKEEVINFLLSKGYIFSPISNLGITEISFGCYLYEGIVYYRDKGNAIKNLSGLLSIISGKSSDTISLYLKGKGVLSEEVLENMFNKKDCSIKFKGKVYSSYSKLAKEFGFSVDYLYKGLSKGLGLEEIISNYKSRWVIVDHLGTEYSCVGEMLDTWGITPKAYRYRKSVGWSLEKILTTPVKRSSLTKECVDFNGKIFPSMELMAKEYGVTQTSILNHMKGGKTPAEALKHILGSETSIKKVSDHLGNSFPSQAKMVEYWKVHYPTFRYRMRKGWSLEEALTGDRKRGN